MMDKIFLWDEQFNGLILTGISEAEDEERTGQMKTSYKPRTSDSKIYCPHSYLILHFQEGLSPSEEMRFKKYYLRKTSQAEANIIILQDVKDLALYLLISPISKEFIYFFHLPKVDRFLRTAILYLQHYIEIWEKLMQEQVARSRKIPHTFSGSSKVKPMSELQILRCVLGKMYSDLIMSCQDSKNSHNSITGKKRNNIMMKSKGQKDLRIFEVLITLTARVTWITLHRKYFNLIEVELHRLFRTDAFNTAERRSDNKISQNISPIDIKILHGTKSYSSKSKLLRNSPLVHDLLHMDCDCVISFLENVDAHSNDDYINYLRNALLAKEEMLPQLGIRVGILGESRSDFDTMLRPSEEAKYLTSKKHIVKMGRGKQKRFYSEEDRRSWKHRQIKETSDAESDTVDTSQQYLINVRDSFFLSKEYKKMIVDARKKWIKREINRHETKQSDTLSVATTVEYTK